jgi:hypothetical protein
MQCNVLQRGGRTRRLRCKARGSQLSARINFGFSASPIVYQSDKRLREKGYKGDPPPRPHRLSKTPERTRNRAPARGARKPSSSSAISPLPMHMHMHMHMHAASRA